MQNFPLAIDTADLTAYPLQFAWVDPAQLTAHELNWKSHPDSQMTGLAEFISQVGWAGALLYNTATGKMTDGHARKKLPAASRVNGKVTVLYGSWTVDQELAIIRYLDPLGQMYDEDEAALEILDSALSISEESAIAVLSSLVHPTEIDPLDNAIPPDEFPEVDENLPTEHECPKCKYRWSGSSATAKD